VLEFVHVPDEGPMPAAPGTVRPALGKFSILMLCAAIAPCFVCAAPPRLQTPAARETTPPSAIPIQSGESREFQLAPGEHRTFLFEAVAGTAANISFEQTKEMLNVAWTSGGTPQGARANDAGLHSPIRFTVVRTDKSEQIFDASCVHPRLPCAGVFTVSLSRPATDADVKVAENEQTLAEAEDSRRHGNESTWALALAKYRGSADFFRNAGDGMRRRAALNGEARLLLFRLSDYHAAHDAALESTTVETGDADLQGQGLAWKTLSSVEYFLGDYNASIRAAENAIALYTRTADAYWQGILLGNVAYTYREIGDTERALECSERALAIARAIQDDFGVIFNLEALATVHLSRGELERAFELYYEALDATHRQPYPAVEGAIWTGLGDLYAQLNDEKRAEESYQKALPLAESAQDAAGLLKIISSLGELYVRQRRPKDALAILRDGLDRANKLGLAREQSVLLTAIAQSEAQLGDTHSATNDFRAAIDAATRIGNRDAEAAALLHFGDFESQNGDAALARDAYRKAFESWTAESNRAQAAIALASLARLDSAAGDLPKARQEIGDALDFFETSRATLASRDLRTSFFSSKHAYYDLAISILMRLHAADSSSGFGAAAFAVSERANARALLDEMATRGAPAFIGAPADLVRDQQANQSRLDAMYAQLRSLSEDPVKNAGKVAKVRAGIEEQLRSSDILDARIRAASGGYAAFTGSHATTAPQIAAKIGPRSALLKFWIGEDASYLWIVSREGFKSFTIHADREQIHSLADRWLAGLQARTLQKQGENLSQRNARLAASDAAAKSVATALGELLLSPLDDLTDVDRLYIVPDGPLGAIPFAALRIRTAGGRPDSPPTEMLISRYEVLTEPSEATFELLARPRTQTGASPRVAVFADAVYSASDPRVSGSHPPAIQSVGMSETLRLATEAGMANLPRLAGSGDEARSILSLNGAANTSVHLGFQAAAAAVRDQNWDDYRIVHFGVHALMNPGRPAFSGVVLTMVGRDGAPQNGVLWLSGIYALHMPVDLVVLSGCHTAAGREIPGEGLEGLSRAFFFAGARSVVGSLWSVEDRETSLLMQRFYQNLLAKKMPPAAALRRAQLDTARDPATSAPFHWAGFTVQGAGAEALEEASVH
jgi:CHAT domain-containing protein/tetratricopeptide (TPR) repeat protein